jgi:hypothetical protein
VTYTAQDLQSALDAAGVKYFSAREFLGGLAEMPAELAPNAIAILLVADKVRTFMGEPLKLTSGYRPAWLNKKVGGAANSSHIYAAAVDLRVSMPWVRTASNERLRLAGALAWIADPNVGGLGLYAQNIHLDSKVTGKTRRAAWASVGSPVPRAASERMEYLRGLERTYSPEAAAAALALPR